MSRSGLEQREGLPVAANTTAPLGSVVIVNYNGGSMVFDAIDSVLRQTVADLLEIIVVDNGSTDGSPEAIEQRYGEQVCLVRSKNNVGFAGGNNLGFARARGDFLLLLNNDAVAEPDWAEIMIREVGKHPLAGMVTPKIVCLSDPRIIDNAGHRMFRDGLNRSRGHLELDKGQYDVPEEVLFASGCAALYRRLPVMQMGGFDEEFFAYGDDADLGLKLRVLGLNCRYTPAAKVYHRQSATAQPYSLRKIYLIERNRVWILLKFFPATCILSSPWFTFARLFGSWQASRRGEGLAGEVAKHYSSAELLGTIVKAWLAAFANLPRMWRKRKQLMAVRTSSATAWKALLRRFECTCAEMTFGSRQH